MTRHWLVLPLLLAALALTRPASADDCAAFRNALKDRETAALRTKDPCRALRGILSEANARSECNAETRVLRAEVEGYIRVRCPCPEDPAGVLKRCEAVATASETCGSARAASVLECIYTVKKLAPCPTIPPKERERVESELRVTYGGCPLCKNSKETVDTAIAAVKIAKSCDELNAHRQTQSALLECPNAGKADLSSLATALTNAKARLHCDDPSPEARLYRGIETLNREIRESKDCSNGSRCADLEMQRLFALAAYLELVRVLAPTEQARALRLLRAVGTDPSLIELVKKYGADQLRTAASIASVFSSPELDQFLSDLEASSMPKLAKELRDNKGSLEAFLGKFFSADAETQRRALSLADSLSDSAEAFQESLSRHGRRGGWQLWIEGAAQCDVFANALSVYFKGGPEPIRDRPATEFNQHLRSRHASCQSEQLGGTKPSDPKQSACGLLLRVRLTVRGSEVDVHGDVYFLDGKKMFKDVRPRPVTMPMFTRGTGEPGAAQEFARRALVQVSALWPDDFSDSPPPVAPSKHCGVAVSYFPHFRPAPLGKGLEIQGNCNNPTMVVGLKTALSGNGLVGIVSAVDRPSKSRSAKLVLNSGEGSSGIESCSGELFYVERQARYTVKAVVDTTTTCPGEEPKAKAEKRWELAGRDLGDLIANYYAQPVNVAVEANTTESSGWYALAFAGAPYLQDSRAATWSKVVPSVLDGALLIGAGVAYGTALKYRNDAAREPGGASVEPSNIALNVGTGLAIAWFSTRIVAGLGYWQTDIWKKGNP